MLNKFNNIKNLRKEVEIESFKKERKFLINIMLHHLIMLNEFLISISNTKYSV